VYAAHIPNDSAVAGDFTLQERRARARHVARHQRTTSLSSATAFSGDVDNGDNFTMTS
jgi:hypothetical protein